MPGPAKMPTVLQLVKGNPGKRAINKNEPQPPRGKLKPPKRFTTEAKKWFRDIVAKCESMGVVTSVDDLAIELLVDAYSEYLNYGDEIEKNGGPTYTTTSVTGSVLIKAHPAVAMRSNAWNRINSMLQQFGLTPSSRSKVQTNSPKDSRDVLDDLLN